MEYLIGMRNTCGERYVSGCSPSTECSCHGVCAREVPADPALGWGHGSPLPAAFHFSPLAFCAWLFAFEVYTESACFKAFPQKVLSCLTGVSLWITSSVFKKLLGTGALGEDLRGWGCPLGSRSFPADPGLLEIGGLYVMSDFCSPFINSDNRSFAAFSERWFCSLAVSSTLSSVSCLVWFCFFPMFFSCPSCHSWLSIPGHTEGAAVTVCPLSRAAEGQRGASCSSCELRPHPSLKLPHCSLCWGRFLAHG